MSANATIEQTIGLTIESFQRLREHVPAIAAAADRMITAMKAGGKVMFCGNGGSAADAQHLAAELMGRFMRERDPLPALALTVDTSALTAIGNDYGYENVFSRQLRGIGRSGDVLVGISTSGNSRNVVLALEAARRMGIHTIGLTGTNPGLMQELCDVLVNVPAARTDLIQQMHITVGHILCGLIEEAFV
ncbi:MAG: D-sedoheptulose 7-phosphate isomerase [Alphaproteobacteria bacterium]|nr:D-sedoheptulose 7-phosphate isomerase [Alphaproteobacteria bacterium]